MTNDQFIEMYNTGSKLVRVKAIKDYLNTNKPNTHFGLKTAKELMELELSTLEMLNILKLTPKSLIKKAYEICEKQSGTSWASDLLFQMISEISEFEDISTLDLNNVRKNVKELIRTKGIKDVPLYVFNKLKTIKI